MTQDARHGRHCQYHNVNRSTTSWSTGKKAIHFHLHVRKENGHIDGILNRHGPQVELVNRPKHLQGFYGICKTLRANPELFGRCPSIR